jgi:hypothetical protein
MIVEFLSQTGRFRTQILLRFFINKVRTDVRASGLRTRPKPLHFRALGLPKNPPASTLKFPFPDSGTA